jgi:hypothetical protein
VLAPRAAPLLHAPLGHPLNARAAELIPSREWNSPRFYWFLRGAGNGVPMSQHDTPTPISKNTVEARAAVTGHNVRYVLGVSLVAAVIAFAILSLYFFH